MEKKCPLCGGEVDSSNRCTFCGLDNTKNDKAHHNKKSEQQYATIDYSKMTKTKNKKANKSRVVPVIIIAVCSILFIAIVGFILLANYSIFMFTNELKEEGLLSPDYEYEEYLTAGIYEVGVHIPKGTYDIWLEFGEYGYVEHIQHFDDMTYGNLGYGLNRQTCKNVEDINLSEGDVITISSEIMVKIGSWDAERSNIHNEKNPLSEEFEINDLMMAGSDFPAGVYDIHCMDSLASSGLVKIFLWDTKFDRVYMEEELEMGGLNGSLSFYNVPFTVGSYIDVQVENVKIVPSSYVGMDDSRSAIPYNN